MSVWCLTSAHRSASRLLTSSRLFIVGIIAINGDHVAEEADGKELLRFVVTFAMSWRIWSDIQQVVGWFETDDILQRVEILFVIACLLG